MSLRGVSTPKQSPANDAIDYKIAAPRPLQTMVDGSQRRVRNFMLVLLIDTTTKTVNIGLAENGGGVVGFDEAACAITILERT